MIIAMILNIIMMIRSHGTGSLDVWWDLSQRWSPPQQHITQTSNVGPDMERCRGTRDSAFWQG